MTIDMQSYQGEILDQAPSVDQNSYQQEAQDAPLGMAQVQEAVAPAPMAEAPPQDQKFAGIREEVDRIKADREEERRTIQLQLDMLRANQAQPRQEQAQRKFLDGMGDSDIPNVGEIRKEWEARESAYQSKISELEFAQYHPDYAETLDKHLAPLVKNKPILAEVIRNSPNPAMAAYEIGQLAKGAISNTPPIQTQKSINAQRIVDNARKPGTLSQTGGQGALSKADYYANMSDTEFAKFASQHFD